MFRNLALMGLCTVGLFTMGCRNDQTFTPTDLARAPHDMGGTGNDIGSPGNDGSAPTVKCSTGYTDTTIAAMRTAGKSGCYRVGMMAPVVALASVGTSTHADLILQDSAGGDFSAMDAQCDTRSKATTAGYGCASSLLSGFEAVAAGNAVVASFFYVKSKTGGEEFFNVIDSFTDKMTAGTKPAALTPSLADIAHMSTTITAKDAYQFANVNLGGATLNMYDFAPAAFKPTTAPTNCAYPAIFGFGVIPSTTTATAGPACAAGQMEMPATSDPTEILVGTTFYKGFTLTSDCQCSKSPDILVTAGESFSKLDGIIMMQGTQPSIAPTSNADVGK